MPNENLISVKIPPGELEQIDATIKTLRQLLDKYAIVLKPEERKGIAKMSDGTIPFVEKALDYTVSDPQFAPPFLDVNEMNVDLNAVRVLTSIFRPLGQLTEGLNNSILLSGSEAYLAALAYYNSVKQGVRMKVAGAQKIYDDLSRRFPGGHRSSKTTEEPSVS